MKNVAYGYNSQQKDEVFIENPGFIAILIPKN